MTDSRIDTVIIGGGQAGLALGYHLRRARRRFTIVEASHRIGDSWRRRWDSLTLFTPRRDDALPGMPFPGPSRGFPGKDEVADYLEAYAHHFHLPVELGSPVTSVRRDLSDGFAVETGFLELSARQVVVATGYTQPIVPRFAARLDPRIAQLHTDRYRNPRSVPEGRIVVVGSGRTAVEIAEELAAAGRQVVLSVTSVIGMVAGSRVARVARVVDADSDELVLVTGERLSADGVVWATGYRPHYPWLHLPVIDEFGAPIHDQGITEVPGLAFLGLPGQRTRASALLGGVGRDAALLAGALGGHLAAPPRRLTAPVHVS
jgi:putative flavoprotein involved in K+ transport